MENLNKKMPDFFAGVLFFFRKMCVKTPKVPKGSMIFNDFRCLGFVFFVFLMFLFISETIPDEHHYHHFFHCPASGE